MEALATLVTGISSCTPPQHPDPDGAIAESIQKSEISRFSLGTIKDPRYAEAYEACREAYGAVSTTLNYSTDSHLMESNLHSEVLMKMETASDKILETINHPAFSTMQNQMADSAAYLSGAHGLSFMH